MGLYFSGLYLLPSLNNGINLASFKAIGNIPLDKDLLNK